MEGLIGGHTVGEIGKLSLINHLLTAQLWYCCLVAKHDYIFLEVASSSHARAGILSFSLHAQRD